MGTLITAWGSQRVAYLTFGNLVHWRHEADGQWRIVGDAPVSALPSHPPSQ